MQVDHILGAAGFDIGDTRLVGRVVLAPLSGVTDVSFRRIANRFGAALVVSEMVASDDYVRGAVEARLRAEGTGIEPHVIQLAGCEPRWIGEAARLAEASGAAIIDINMGCPAKRVTGGYAGSALMRDLDLATALIDAAVRAVSVPVTVKMRLGWDHASLNARELARRAAAAGVAAVTVHGRTRQQFYKGAADWGLIADVARAVAVPVIANGDIGCLRSAREALWKSGAAAVMVGRAAVGQPWLVGQVAAGLQGRCIPEPDAATKAAVAVEHYEGLLSLLGREVGMRHARKHLAAYAERAGEHGFQLSEGERNKLVTSDEPRVVVRLLNALFAEREIRAAA